MADLASLLKDPNYTGANDATKQAIFDKFSAQDQNFSGANPATQSAIRSKFGLSAPAPAAAAAAPELTTSQKIYQAARPYVAPLIEGAGLIGGGLLGAGAGTLAAPGLGSVAGAVGGAGLGYGIAKEGMEHADVAMGMKPMRQGAAQVMEPIRNIAEGATMEVGGRVAGQALGKVVNTVAGLASAGTQKAATIGQKALGKDLPEVLLALKNAPANANVADVTAGIQNPTWQALIKDALQKDPQFVRKAQLASDAESTNVLAKLAGGATAAETRGVNEMAKSNLANVTSPMRETAVARANLGKYVADEAAGRRANDMAVMVGSGNKIDPVQFAAQATGAEKALRSVGIKPLEGAPLASRIEAIPKNPSFAENDLVEGSTQKVAEGIRKWTDSGGVIDANALEAIRKNSVNAAIAKLRPGADATAQRSLAAGVMSKIKPMIDDAIEGAGGAGWKDYLSTHSKGMQDISAKKLTGEAAQLWKTNKDAFVNLVQNESPAAVEKVMGPGNYDIAKSLSADTMDALRAQANKHLTEVAVKDQVGEGGAALSNLIKQQTSILRVPQFLNFWASASNKAIGELERHVGAKSMRVLTEAMKSPESAAAMLQTLPATERSRVLNLIANPDKLSGAAINALAPQQQNTNALSR